MSYGNWIVRILSWSFLLGWEEKESLTKPQGSCMQVVHNLWGWVLVGRGGRGSFPQLLDIQGPSWTLKEQPQGMVPIQKISVWAAMLILHRFKLCLLIAPLEFWGVWEWGHGAHHHSPYFWDNILQSPLWPCRFQVSVAQGHSWHRWGCAHLTLLSQPSPRSACSVQ